jgi:hypothetical protein
MARPQNTSKSSTTIFTTLKSTGIGVPRTLSMNRKKGSGHIFLDANTIFYPDWQSQLQTVFDLTRKMFCIDSDDFFVSIDSKAVNGWSTSVPLFLLCASVITETPLPDNIFSTGCMYSPDGWVSFGKAEAVQAKIDASEAFATCTSIENPQFLIPFSLNRYKSKRVCLTYVKSVFSALKIALPQVYQEYITVITKLSHVTSQPDLQDVLEYIPDTGEVFALICTDQHPSYSQKNTNSVPVIVPDAPSGRMYLYFIKDNTVEFKHHYTNKEHALADTVKYTEVLHAES